jgi:hypothetical protein
LREKNGASASSGSCKVSLKFLLLELKPAGVLPDAILTSLMYLTSLCAQLTLVSTQGHVVAKDM